MRKISESVEQLISHSRVHSDQGGVASEIFGAVVVGSGYGGAVSALRLSEAGVKVLVLERGNEYASGDFPNDIANALGQVRFERNESRNINGYESGLYDIRWGDGVGALVASGLGGTSLINAGVALEPDPRVFALNAPPDEDGKARPLWPTGLQAENGKICPTLRDGFDKALHVLAPEQFKGVWAFPTNLAAGAPGTLSPPLKERRLKEMAARIAQAAGNFDVRHVRANLTISFAGSASQQACSSCGECVSGCNNNAKKTLPYTYIPQARDAGARFFTGATVLSVRREKDYWAVQFVRTASRKQQRDGVKTEVFDVLARSVVLSAGTLGSTEILLRSSVDSTLKLSAQLGQRFSTNGDSLAFGYRLKDRVNAMGVGSREASGSQLDIGPTITGMVRVDHATDVTQSVLIQDGAIPSAISRLFVEMMSTSGALSQLGGWRFLDEPGSAAMNPPKSESVTDWAALLPQAGTHTQTLLGMGHDPSKGTLALKADKLQLAYPAEHSKPVEGRHRLHMQHVVKSGVPGEGMFLPNPVLQPLPDEVAHLLSGPELNGGAFTVHPLGGCCMADSAEHGVVNHIGEVFCSTAGTESHEGLYVLDGSIVPCALGANPLLTITALAERAMAIAAPAVARRVATATHQPNAASNVGVSTVGADAPGSVTAPAKTGQPAYNPHANEVGVHFTEGMRSAKGDFFTWPNLQNATAHLILHLPINDLALFGTDGRHLITLPNLMGAETGDKERLTAELRIDGTPYDKKTSVNLQVVSGWVSILPVPEVRWLGAASAVVRTALTWLFERGADEFWQWIHQPSRPAKSPPSSAGGSKIWGFFKMCRHASEVRVMTYRLQLQDEQSRGEGIKTYTLNGTKNVGYPASWRALSAYFFKRQRPLMRPNVWSSFGELQTSIVDDAGVQVGGGMLKLDMLDMTKIHAPQLGALRDTPNALLALAGYPLWFARLMIKTRLWDFRLPDYPCHMPTELTSKVHGDEKVPIPKSDEDPVTLWPKFPPLKLMNAQGMETGVDAQESIAFTVRRSALDPMPVELKLTRYKQAGLTHDKTTHGMQQFKVLLMLNGFAQSTLGFVPEEHVRRVVRPDDTSGLADEPGLAAFFYEQGFDIWLFDYRTSSILDASKLPCSMDDIAQFDIPAAVDQIIQVISAECSVSPDKVQIYAYAHCVGAASMAMSLLGGHLTHNGKEEPSVSKLAGVTLSQMQAFLIGSKTAQMRLQVGGLLRDALGIEYLRLSAAEREPTALESVLDRLFASLPVDPGEHCPGEFERSTPQPYICTCKRMSGTISRLLKHDRLKRETHDKLAVYFGRANTSLLVHGGRCVENERLVNADGQNVYVTDSNILKYLDIPVAILHGTDNALFDFESATRTTEQLRRVKPALWDARISTLIRAQGFAHFDCTIGFGPDMHAQILNPLRAFHEAAWTYQKEGLNSPEPALNLVPRIYAKAPLAGPMVGWTRTDTRDGNAVRVVRVWIEVDEDEADKALYVVTDARAMDGGPKPIAGLSAQMWPITRVPMRAVRGRPDVADLAPLVLDEHEPYLAIAMADLVFDISTPPQTAVWVKMFSVHPMQIELPVSASREPHVTEAGPTTTSPPGPHSSPAPADPPPITRGELAAAILAGLKPTTVGPKVLAQWRSRFFSHVVTGAEFAADKGVFKARLHASGAMHPQDAATLWSTLAGEVNDKRERALRASPGTLSRKLRLLALNGAYGLPFVRLAPHIIAGPNVGTGLTFMASSCRHPGVAFEDKRADRSLEYIQTAARTGLTHPAFMFMLGDQIYADASAGVIDSPSAVERVALRHRKAFTTVGFAELTSTLPTYMAMDDHEIADNWSTDELEYADPTSTRAMEAHTLHATARAAYAAYQWAHGPRNTSAPGFNYHFDEAGCAFFVLDTRSQRTRFPAYPLLPQVCSQAQMAELKRWLAALPKGAQPKFIVSGSVFAPGLHDDDTGNPALSSRMSDTWQMAQAQRSDVLHHIATEQVQNVVFLSGDYHCAAIAEIEIASGQIDARAPLRAYAIVVPPLYAPLPFANASASDIMTTESVPLGAGAMATITTRVESEGDGFAQVSVRPLPMDTWQLDIEFHQADAQHKTTLLRRKGRTFTLT